jgi:hypothetical protein
LGSNCFSTTSQAGQTVFVKYMKVGRGSFLANNKTIFHEPLDANASFHGAVPLKSDPASRRRSWQENQSY